MEAPTLVPAPGGAADALLAAVECARRGVRGALATVVERHGSAPSTPGQKLFAGADGTCVGTVGGGAVEREVLGCLQAMLSADEAPRETRTFQLGAELGMCCGGRVEVFLEPMDAVVPCLVVGGGHVATALAPLLVRLGFSVTVVDAREDWGREGRLEGVRCLVGEFDDPECGLDDARAPATAVLVMTHDHALDQQIIEGALARRAGFVGGVGSRAKAKRTRDRLEAKGFAATDIARVRMPLGVDIGARLPDEIAVSIAAEMVAWRRASRAKMDSKP
jgi:xanthine dehydrogenase accessory factor